jgi:hypothetical protein
VITKHQQNIMGFIMRDQDKSWDAHKVCYVCVEELKKWPKGKKKAFRFCVPVTWREPKSHSDDCYFCLCDVKGYNSKNKKVILYANLPSDLRPVVYDVEVPVPRPTKILEDASTNSSNSGGDFFFC